MSLLSFHRFLIAAAILFCAGYAGMELAAALRGPGEGSFWVGGTFAVLAAALLVYRVRLRHFLGYGEDAPSRR